MKSLKTFAAVCAAALALAACEKENELPTVSFEKSNEVIDSEQEAAVKVVLSQAPAADLTVNFEVVAAGDLKDAYTIGGGDETSLVIKAGETEGTVTVRNNGTSLTTANITLRLATIEGYKSGMNPQILISLGAAEKIIYTFERPRVRITENSTVTVNLKIAGEESGDSFKNNSALTIPIKIAEGSTAVEGTDFTLGSENVVFAAGSNSASFTITAGEGINEADVLPTLELELAPASDRVVAGAVSKLTVVYEKMSDTFNGTWKMDADLHVEDDNLGMIGMCEAELGVTIPFPAIDNNDSFTISLNGKTGSFRPSFTGDLKRYFRECSLSSPVLAQFEHPTSGEVYDTYAVTFSTVNFDFGTTNSDLKSATIYFFQPKEENGEVNPDILELFLFCTDDLDGFYEKNYSVHSDFGGDLESYGMKVTDFMGEMFSLHYRFTRAE